MEDEHSAPTVDTSTKMIDYDYDTMHYKVVQCKLATLPAYKHVSSKVTSQCQCSKTKDLPSILHFQLDNFENAMLKKANKS